MSVKDRYAGSNTKAGGLGTALGFAVANAIAIPLGLTPDEPLYLLIVGLVSVLGSMLLSYLTKNDQTEVKEEAVRTRDELLKAWLALEASNGNGVHRADSTTDKEVPTSTVVPEVQDETVEAEPEAVQEEIPVSEVPTDENGYPDFSKL